MITVKRIRKAPAYATTCPVCRTRIAPQGANMRIIIDAEKRGDRNQRDRARGLRPRRHRLHPRARLRACGTREGRGLDRGRAMRPIWTLDEILIPSAQMLSLNDRGDRRRTAPTVKNLRTTAMIRARAAGIGRSDRLRIVAWLRFPDSRRRDPHNYMPTLKAMVDGFVDAGVLPDDDRRHLQGPDLRCDLLAPMVAKRLGSQMFGITFEAYPFEGRAGTIG
uniref:Crossover junction endodeoxyribonuclease n=1 Tax=Siphoviridae sp. ctJyX12 TaxID=2827840 RepID=A0A8S5SR63_9CAUD|nr:MAG TPA: crossover junction endodeoxyribonuclease [Siphoviridae sp. ctJyX12]